MLFRQKDHKGVETQEQIQLGGVYHVFVVRRIVAIYFGYDRNRCLFQLFFNGECAGIPPMLRRVYFWTSLHVIFLPKTSSLLEIPPKDL